MPPSGIQAQPRGNIRARFKGVEKGVPTPDRRAVILAPALGCPGIACIKPKGAAKRPEIDVILMMRTELRSPAPADVAGALGWRRWESRDRGPFAPIRPEQVLEVKVYESWADLKSHNLSLVVEQRYVSLGYGTRVHACVQTPLETGMHAPIALHDENRLLHAALLLAVVPYSRCPALDDTNTPGFKVGIAAGPDADTSTRPVSAYHPVSVFPKTSNILTSLTCLTRISRRAGSFSNSVGMTEGRPGPP